MVEAQGGEALTELVLDRAITARLRQESLTLDDAAIQDEQQRLLDSLSADEDEAALLLQQMRQQRGLGERRFAAMLRRNAGLRLLVRDDVTVGEPAIRQAFELRYGTRYQVRLITAEAVSTLSTARQQAIGGASFTDLAIQLSTDASARQGGLLSPISPADPTYPQAVRDALAGLSLESAQTRLSPVIALPDGYALLWLEEVITESPPPIEQVRAELEQAVRADLERVRMQQLARSLIGQVNAVVLDPALERSWQQQRETIVQP